MSKPTQKNGPGRSRRARVIGTLAAIAALAGAGTSIAPAATAASNPFERGPAPAETSVTAPQGPFATQKTVVSKGSAQGFGGGTIYYPTDTSAGTFGAVVIAPGFGGSQSNVAWYGGRVASQGFVVFTIDTLGLFDFPDQRGDQLLAALDYLTNNSTVKNRIDANRLSVMGHSMGGGGTLAATTKRPQLKAAIPLAPWHMTKNWSKVTTPTLIIVGEKDTTASPESMAEPFYTSISAQDKACLELRGGDHNVETKPNTVIAKYAISWLKRFVDNDTRYDQFLCPPPAPDNKQLVRLHSQRSVSPIDATRDGQGKRADRHSRRLLLSAHALLQRRPCSPWSRRPGRDRVAHVRRRSE